LDIGRFVVAGTPAGVISDDISIEWATINLSVAFAWDFDPSIVRFGSFATNQYVALSGRMSASPPIATELMQRREPTRCAISGLMHRSKTASFDRLVGAAYSGTRDAW
jgi:hypothetical protein